MNYLELGPVPAGEDCAQVGSPDYTERMIRETTEYIRMLSRAFPPIAGTRFKLKAFRHDFGTNHEVVVVYTDSDEAIDFAFHVENNTPMNWDDEARRNLGL